MSKSNKSARIAAINEKLAAFAQAKRDTVAMLTAVGVLDDRQSADLRDAQNRLNRAERFINAMQSESFANAVLNYAENIGNVLAVQIYAQDKILETLRAIAADCKLSAVAKNANHSNRMTQTLIEALDKFGPLTVSDAPKRMHDLNPRPSMGTYSAQASSSRQCLEALGLLDWNSALRTFALNERGEALRHVIAH